MAYKTSEMVRAKALAYYYANKEECRARQERYRREQGTPVAAPKMTDAEKLAKVRICKCGAQVTTPSLLLQCSNICLRCRANTSAGKASKAKGNRAHKDSPAHARAKVKAYKREQGCKRCGARPKATLLHFHHRDPETKLFKVAWGVYHVSAKVLWDEIAKCDVLCKGCHEEAHA